MLLSDAVAIYVDGRAARGEVTAVTASHFRSRLASLVAVAGPEVAQLDRAQVAAWQASIGHQRPASRRAYLSTVKTFCRWAVVEGLLPADPTLAVARVREPHRPPRRLSAGQVARLGLVLPDLRAEVIIALMFGCGLRCCEVARLTIEDYDPAAGELVVVGKNSDGRLLPVPAPVDAVLARWLAARGWPPGAPGRPGRPHLSRCWCRIGWPPRASRPAPTTGSPPTPYATPSPPTCSTGAGTSAPSRPPSATRAWPPPSGTYRGPPWKSSGPP